MGQTPSNHTVLKRQRDQELAVVPTGEQRGFTEEVVVGSPDTPSPHLRLPFLQTHMHVHARALTHVCTQAYTHTQAHTATWPHVCTRIHKHQHVCACTHVCTHTSAHSHAHMAYTYTHMYKHACTHMGIHTCVYTGSHRHTDTYTSAHTCTYTHTAAIR